MHSKVASNPSAARIASDRKIAYISSEFALSDDLPLYAGGLGVLAADILYQASEDGFPLIGISVFYREGFFKQRIDSEGNQETFYEYTDPAKAGLVDTNELIKIPLPGHNISLKIWRKDVSPIRQPIPLYLLDSDIPENKGKDRVITNRLYEKVWAPRLIDDLVLGIGSVRAVRKLKIPIQVWHINDDHGTFNLLERLREELTRGLPLKEARKKVKTETIFTTHTPVAGAESKFSKEEIMPALDALFHGLKTGVAEEIYNLGKRKWEGGEVFSLTVFSMRHARAINTVSKKHLEVAKDLWGFIGKLPLSHITNAVYAPRWTAPELRNLWKADGKVDDRELWQAKLDAKKRVSEELGKVALDHRKLDPQSLILCWSRRFTKYKQPTLLVSDLARLTKILTDPKRPVYLLMSGKAHPEDPQGQEFVKEIITASRSSQLKEHLIYFPDYGLDLARDLLAATDVWLNTPVPGWEASGTSGMKAVYNSALNASTLDGWWLEGFQPARGEQMANGWVIKGPNFAESLYRFLEEEVIPLYYQRKGGLPEGWIKMVQEALRTCGPQFNAGRMLGEYKRLYPDEK